VTDAAVFPATGGLRERRRAQTADEIERTALALFVERGFGAVTVEEIASSAGVSPRTFFRYFPSKELVLLRDQDRRISQLRDALAARPDDEPVLASMRRALVAMAEEYEADRDHAVQWATVIADTPSLLPRFAGYATEFMTVVTLFVAGRLGLDPQADLRPGVIAVAMTGATHVAYERWLADPSVPLPALVGESLDLVETGFRTVVRGALR
jgi:AcrR family transcriptional regulator